MLVIFRIFQGYLFCLLKPLLSSGQKLSNRSLCWDGHGLYICYAAKYSLVMSTWKVASVTEELKFQFYLILPNLYVNNNMWLEAIVLDNAVFNAKERLF